MSDQPYNVEAHTEGALRRVYQARRTLSHIDAATMTPEQFEQVRAILAALEELENDFEGSVFEQRREPDDTAASPLEATSHD